MSTFDETQHERDHAGRFTEVAGAEQEDELATDKSAQARLELVAEQRAAAVDAYRRTSAATAILAAQEVALRVRQRYPDARAVAVEESDQSYDRHYYPVAVILADGREAEVDDELSDDVSDQLWDISGTETWAPFGGDGENLTMDLDDALRQPVPQHPGRFVSDDEKPAPERASARAQHFLRQWADLPDGDDDDHAEDFDDSRETAVKEVMTDLVHYCAQRGIPIYDVLNRAQRTAAEQVREPF
ncbi:hypothetical protein [Microbacterium enclense]|uniref:hypothetical protein n=1 Tax=Microbacterium enclense TaxID=993073 RepID=UPI003F7EAF18